MKVLVFGATHGNEWTGARVVQHYLPHFKRLFPQLDLHLILANPKAHHLNKRFLDEDLNRAFQYLSEERPSSYEHARALEIKALIESGPCFVIDLHTTTSNMGATVIMTHLTPLNLHLCAQLTKNAPECRIISSPDPMRKYLASQSDQGLMIEVGPVAHGVVDPKALESTLKILESLLKLLSEGSDSSQGGEVDVFEEVQDIHYPMDEAGSISAYIHSSLQGKDFIPLSGSFPAFQSFQGETLNLRNDEELYPIFINEAAYYSQKLAFTLCRRAIKKY